MKKNLPTNWMQRLWKWADNNDISLPRDRDKLIGLKKLDLGHYNLTKLPKEVGNLVGLTELTLYCNQLTELPKEIGNLINLEQLHLEDNKLTKLPKEIGNLVNLTELHLGDNQFSEFPKEVCNLVSLTSLVFGANNDYDWGNQITELPKEIGNLVNLIELDLIDNHLTGLPKEIGNLVKLERLYLGGNQFTKFPIEIFNLTNSTEIDVYPELFYKEHSYYWLEIYLKKLAEQGLPMAQCELASYYLEDFDWPPSKWVFESFLEMFRAFNRDEYYDADEIYNNYLEDIKNAIEWYKKSADQGFVAAQDRLKMIKDSEQPSFESYFSHIVEALEQAITNEHNYWTERIAERDRKYWENDPDEDDLDDGFIPSVGVLHESPLIEYYLNGKRKSEIRIHVDQDSDVPIGVYEVIATGYNINGRKIIVTNFWEGVKHGVETVFSAKSGKKKLETTWDRGTEIQNVFYFPDGKSFIWNENGLGISMQDRS